MNKISIIALAMALVLLPMNVQGKKKTDKKLWSLAQLTLMLVVVHIKLSFIKWKKSEQALSF